MALAALRTPQCMHPACGSRQDVQPARGGGAGGEAVSLFEVDGRLQRLVRIALEALARVGDERRDLDERALVAAHRGTRREQPAPTEL